MQFVADDLGHPDRLVKRCRWDVGHAELDRALLQRRHELLAEEREQSQGCDQQGQGRADDQLLALQCPVKQGQVGLLCPAHDERVLLLFGLEDECGEYWHQRHRQQQRAGHRERDRQRHRLEQLAFEPGQREQRQEDHDDDDDRKRDRVDHLARRFQDQVRLVDRLAGLPRMRQQPEGVLDQHHRPVHHHPRADGQTGQRHQVGRDAELLHQDERNQHRQWQGDDHDDGRAEFAEEQEQYDRHQDGTLDQRTLRRPQRLLDQFGAVVVRHQRHALGQCRLRHGQLGLHRVHNRLRVLVDPCQRDAQHGLLAVLGDGAEARCRRLLDLCHVAHVDRRAVALGDHDPGNVLRVAHQPQAAHEVLLGAQVDRLPAHLLVVRGEALHHLLERQAVLDELTRVDLYLVLLLIAAPGHHVIDTRRGAQDQPHRPVVQGPQVHRGELLVGRLDRVPEHLAQAGAVRPEHRLAVALRQSSLHILELLADEPSCEIDVDVVLEIDRHIRQAEQRDGPNLFDAGQACHAAFDGRGEQFLDILGGEAGRLGVDADLDRRHVGEGVHGHLAERLDAQADHDDEGDEDEDFVAQ